jgi:hypothetical protein
MAQVVRAFPLLTSVADLAAFAAELAGPRREECAAFFRRYNIRHESWHLQDHGPWAQVLVVTELDDPQRQAVRFAASTHPFDVWYKQRARQLTGVDLSATPKGPPTCEVFRWQDGRSSASRREAA